MEILFYVTWENKYINFLTRVAHTGFLELEFSSKWFLSFRCVKEYSNPKYFKNLRRI